ncbi:hypothetical protein [Winogradskyella jejuensis]|uniref:Uncharacterized protein n=1 Tax=Winogradskyella jejuensis TaxID=1089305 RepID=A0A1M5L7R2_9FLAO|nr:hypothetical protein [Winogradskyella jejuensis]SHG61051.1 hypothetical protein SAMN05444148_0549 [Winogradskyella jejuensis]
MPLGESMLSTIRSNKSIRIDKSKHFRKTKSVYGENSKTEYNFPEASPELLEKIKERIQKENKKTRTKMVVISTVLVVVVLILLFLI